jgi:hypothetical protein
MERILVAFAQQDLSDLLGKISRNREIVTANSKRSALLELQDARQGSEYVLIVVYEANLGIAGGGVASELIDAIRRKTPHKTTPIVYVSDNIEISREKTSHLAVFSPERIFEAPYFFVESDVVTESLTGFQPYRTLIGL